MSAQQTEAPATNLSIIPDSILRENPDLYEDTDVPRKHRKPNGKKKKKEEKQEEKK